MDRLALLTALNTHQAINTLEAEHQQRTIDFVEQHEDCCNRHLADGHITASCWIVDENHQHALLTHHRKLNRWLQLGGHIEDDQNILAAALREAQEESGLNDIHTVSKGIFDIDVHRIPARQQEAAHHHYDIRFLFQAQRDAALTISDESHDLRWFSITDLHGRAGDDSIDRMVEKMGRLK